uniref:Uncharacterized protein n=1 Tax=Eucampia antarctica TaxID=49252 RepID=A0A7S2W5S9_9STRA|mmetsp:Transcript_20649/g.19875  ORF Transcript_20649/g.19875 Transcript_20649/m.19875 type:complete len:243 (+) Transcript_20649:41-769(+)
MRYVTLLFACALGTVNAFMSVSSPRLRDAHMLHMVAGRVTSLKPAASPLLNSGKAIARSGELLIDLTTTLDLYGGGLSSAGATIRNAGDHIAQAAASCRFKTGTELVCDEIRESATCLLEASQEHFKKALTEAVADKDVTLETGIGAVIPILENAGTSLEAAGAGILQRASIEDVGYKISECGEYLGMFAGAILNLAKDEEEAQIASQRMQFASEQMIEAGNELSGNQKVPEKKTGKGWIKG